jgi:hypothetical protein
MLGVKEGQLPPVQGQPEKVIETAAIEGWDAKRNHINAQATIRLERPLNVFRF